MSGKATAPLPVAPAVLFAGACGALEGFDGLCVLRGFQRSSQDGRKEDWKLCSLGGQTGSGSHCYFQAALASVAPEAARRVLREIAAVSFRLLTG